MILDENSTYYDLLDIKPDATSEEVRQAYLRAKTAYSKDSAALYTLVSPEETKEMLHKIEEAYVVLSNPQKRKEYDAYFGFLDPANDFIEHPMSRGHASHAPNSKEKIISIDRVPPMESFPESGDELLVAPSTDFESSPVQTPFERRSSDSDRRQAARPQQNEVQHAPQAPQVGKIDPELEHEIAIQTEWRGSFLRKVREALKLSIEEVAASTKISKTYLLAIEEENFVKLPAAVFVRGFVMQVAKLLKLPFDKVAATYMERFKQARPS